MDHELKLKYHTLRLTSFEKPFGTFEEINREELTRPMIHIINLIEVVSRTPEKAQYGEIIVEHFARCLCTGTMAAFYDLRHAVGLANGKMRAKM